MIEKENQRNLHFGTMTPRVLMPVGAFNEPMTRADSVLYMYCKQCSSVYELNASDLEDILLCISELQRKTIVINDVDRSKHYILASGCVSHKEEVPIFQLKDISESS